MKYLILVLALTGCASTYNKNDYISCTDVGIASSNIVFNRLMNKSKEEAINNASNKWLGLYDRACYSHPNKDVLGLPYCKKEMQIHRHNIVTKIADLVYNFPINTLENKSNVELYEQWCRDIKGTK